MIAPVCIPFFVDLLIEGAVGAVAMAICAVTPWADHSRRSNPAKVTNHAHP